MIYGGVLFDVVNSLEASFGGFPDEDWEFEICTDYIYTSYSFYELRHAQDWH